MLVRSGMKNTVWAIDREGFFQRRNIPGIAQNEAYSCIRLGTRHRLPQLMKMVLARFKQNQAALSPSRQAQRQRRTNRPSCSGNQQRLPCKSLHHLRRKPG